MKTFKITQKFYFETTVKANSKTEAIEKGYRDFEFAKLEADSMEAEE